MKISFDSKSPKSDALVAFATEGGKLQGAGLDADKKAKGAIKRAIDADKFEGKKGQTLTVAGPEGLAQQHVIVVGLGKADDLKAKDFEKIGSSLVALLNQKKATSAEIAFPVEALAKKTTDSSEAAAAMAQGALLSSYRFDKYLTKEPKEKKPTLKALSFTVDNAEFQADAPAANTGARQHAQIGIRSESEVKKGADGLGCARDPAHRVGSSNGVARRPRNTISKR